MFRLPLRLHPSHRYVLTSKPYPASITESLAVHGLGSVAPGVAPFAREQFAVSGIAVLSVSLRQPLVELPTEEAFQVGGIQVLSVEMRNVLKDLDGGQEAFQVGGIQVLEATMKNVLVKYPNAEPEAFQVGGIQVLDATLTTP